jgi:hypothetical protein
MTAIQLKKEINRIMELNVPPTKKLEMIAELTKSTPTKQPAKRQPIQGNSDSFMRMANKIVNAKRS